ncbi:MAG: helix-turn-helix transcriptional regulator [Verrucomicrobiota bacterium]
MRSTLEQQLGHFLRKKRGSLTYAAFAKKLGLSPATVFRMEMGQQNTTLRTLEQIQRRLNCTIAEIFTEPASDSKRCAD